MEYEVSGPEGDIGGREVCTSSPTDAVIGGIISAWNMRVVGVPLRVVIARATSDEETAGNSSTFCSVSQAILDYRTWSLLRSL